MFFWRVDASRAPPHLRRSVRPRKGIASAHSLTYHNYPALKDPL